MTQINNPKIAFAYLRPACVLLTREPTVANVETLGGQLRALDDATLQQLQEYVLFPLRFVLKLPAGRPRRERLVQSVVEAMTHVLETTCVRSWETLRELLSELCLCLSSPRDPGRPSADASEELKAAVLRCLSALLHAAYGDTLLRLYEAAALPGLGAAVSLLLALAEQEGSREVRLAALGVLQTLGGRCDCGVGGEQHVMLGEGEWRVVGGAMASFLPGITVALTRVVAGDPRHGHAITVGAIKAWYRTVGLVMDDSQLRSPGPGEAGPAGPGRAGELVVLRTPDWAKGTAGRLAILLKRLISCSAAHRHWRVRLELVELADHLLSRCSESLGGECMGPLLEALVGAVNDEEPRVRERCEVALKEASERGRNGGHGNGVHDSSGNPSQTFVEVLSENLHGLATSLPRLLRATDDHKKLLVLNVFLGYLKLLGPLVSQVLNSAAHLHRISKALVQVLELDVRDVRIVEERSSAAVMETASGSVSEGPLDGHTQRKHFLYFRDEKIFSVLMEICRTLGYHGNTYLLVDHFLDLYRESSAYRKQAAMVLNEIIRGAAGISVATWGQGSGGGAGCWLHAPAGGQEERRAVVVAVIEEYTSERNWNLATVSQHSGGPQEQELLSPSRLLSISPGGVSNSASNPLQVVPSTSSSSSPSSSSVHQLNSNIWQLCIQLEGVACGALTLGNAFRPLLMTSLYAVLEKAGDEALLVSQAALACVRGVAAACGYTSPQQLIADNSDYLLNDVSLNLHRLQRNPQAPRVLAVILAHSDPSLLPLVGDVVRDVLLALDLSYDHTAALFCSVLHSLMKALVRWFPASVGGPGRGREESSGDMTALDVRQFLLDYSRQKELAQGIGAEEEEEEEEPVAPPPPEEEEEEQDVKKELPAHILITKEVMQRCTHLLSDPNLHIRLKVLDIVELCVCVLREDEDELLPAVHGCWPALLSRLTDEAPLAVLRGFQVLCTLGEASGDFLRSRVSKEVLPRLGSSLARQALVSARAGPVFTHTLAYKLQLAVLQGLGSLCLRLHLGEADLDAVCDACLPYLSCRQPISLQEACLSVFHHLIRADPDAFWLTLSQLRGPVPYGPPHPLLRPFWPGGPGPTGDQYTHNLDRLLREGFGAPGPLG